MPQNLIERLRRFRSEYFPEHEGHFRDLVAHGQKPSILFIGCSDSRLVPHLLTGTGPGDLFLVRNVAALVPPYDGSTGYHGTCAAIEFAVLNLNVHEIVVCGHSHCGGIRALYEGVSEEAVNLRSWLELAREAALPAEMTEQTLRRTEERSIVLQLERLMDYPMVRSRVEAGQLFLHGWHYVIEEGEVHVFDLDSGRFVSASSIRLQDSAQAVSPKP